MNIPHDSPRRVDERRLRVKHGVVVDFNLLIGEEEEVLAFFEVFLDVAVIGGPGLLQDALGRTDEILLRSERQRYIELLRRETASVQIVLLVAGFGGFFSYLLTRVVSFDMIVKTVRGRTPARVLRLRRSHGSRGTNYRKSKKSKSF
jgi:hypothetical protein